MKNLFKALTLLIIFVLFYSCQNQNESFQEQNPKHVSNESNIKSNVQYEEISFNQFRNKEAPSTLNALGKYLDINNYLKSDEKVDEKFVILTNKVIKIVKNGYPSYTFAIKKNNEEEGSFENLVISKIDSTYKYYRIKYKKEKNSKRPYYRALKEVTEESLDLDIDSFSILTKNGGNNCPLIYCVPCYPTNDSYCHNPERLYWDNGSDAGTCSGNNQYSQIEDWDACAYDQPGGNEDGEDSPYTTGTGTDTGPTPGGGGPVVPTGPITTPTTGNLPSPSWIEDELGIDLTTNQLSFLMDFPVVFHNSYELLMATNYSQVSENFVTSYIDKGVGSNIVTASPLFKYPKRSNYKTLYPKLTEYLMNQLPKVKDIPLIVNTIKDITGLSESRIKKDLLWGQGPTIRITQLDNLAANTNFKTVAFFRKGDPDTIYLDIDYVNDLENNISDQGLEDSYLFFLGVTILHEYVHLGDNVDGIDYAGEEGDLFEMLVYGEDVNETSLIFSLNKK